jgi:hypothetical protein
MYLVIKQVDWDLCSVVNKISTSKNKTRYRYCVIKDSIKNKYSSDEVDLDPDDIKCDS